MKQSSTPLRTGGFLLSILLYSIAVVAADDRVFQTSGAAITGEVQSLDKDKVVIVTRGKDQSVPTIEVSRIVFDGEPNDLSRAKELAANAQWSEADAQLKTVNTGNLKGENVQQDYLYYRGLTNVRLALASGANAAAGASQLVSYAKTNPNSYHFYELCEALGDAAAALGSLNDAVKYYTAIGTAPFPAYKLKSSYLVGTALLGAGQAEQAAAEFDKVLAAVATEPEAQRYQKLARVAKIRASVVAGQADAAVEQLLQLVNESDSADALLYSEIYNALGEAHRKLDQNSEAALAYLHTDLLFPSDPENHAEALYNLSQLWESVGQPSRATDAKSRLQQQYPGSSWAKK